jgi:hypothetical protein
LFTSKNQNQKQPKNWAITRQATLRRRVFTHRRNVGAKDFSPLTTAGFTVFELQIKR